MARFVTEQERQNRAFLEFQELFKTAMIRTRGWSFSIEQIKIIDDLYNGCILPMKATQEKFVKLKTRFELLKE